MERLEFHVSYQCNNNCIFCSEADRLAKFSAYPLTFSEIKNKLIAKRKEGFKYVHFTGGEPTENNEIIDILKIAKKLGYKVSLGSNGNNLADSNFFKNISRYIDEICLSFHGHNYQLFAHSSNNEKSFSNLGQTFKNINKILENKNLDVFINIVLTRNNFKELKEIVKFLLQYKFIKQIIISNFAPEGKGLSNFEKLAVKFTDLRKEIPKIIDLFKGSAVVVRFFGIPFCVLGEENYIYSNDLNWDARLTIERDIDGNGPYLQEIISILPDRNKIKVKKCQECKLDSICSGIFAEYIKLYGDKEINKI